MIMKEIENRFDLLIFETAEKYIERKKKEKQEIDRKAALYKKEWEEKGLCEHCGKEAKCRWVRNDEFYSCYECFYHDLDCESYVMVPMRRVTSMEEYVDEGEWDAMWEYEYE